LQPNSSSSITSVSVDELSEKSTPSEIIFTKN
jgi:hypothetical protein